MSQSYAGIVHLTHVWRRQWDTILSILLMKSLEP